MFKFDQAGFFCKNEKFETIISFSFKKKCGTNTLRIENEVARISLYVIGDRARTYL